MAKNTPNLTPQQIKQEAIRSGKDPIYFMNNYVKISHPLKGIIPFKMFGFQEKVIKDFQKNRFNVVLKARQLGLSTLTAAYAAWLLLFYRDKNILVVATKLQTATNLVKKVKQMIKRLPPWMKITKIKIDNQTSFELDNGSMIKAASTSGDVGRSEAVSLLIIDEAAHVEKLDELWVSMYSTLSTGGGCAILSTPNGCGNFFHKVCIEAENGENDFNLIKLPWDVHPERDLEWYKKETRNMTRRQIAQELEINFNMSGETFFDPEDIEKISKLVKEPKIKTGVDRNLWIWKEFESFGSYMLVADVARGDGEDNSVFHVFDLKEMEVVAEYQGKLSPDIFANLIYQTGLEYGKCMVIVENNSIGLACIQKLIDFEYPNLYYSTKSSHEYVDQYEAVGATNVVAGFSTSQKTRPLILAKMEEFVRNNLIKIYSTRLVNEMRTFIWNNGRAESMRSYNDDLVMACAIACWVRETALNENTREIQYKKSCIEGITISRTQLNTKIPGQFGSPYTQGEQEARDLMNRYGWMFPTRG